MDEKLRLFEEVLFTVKEKSVEHTFVPKHPKLKGRLYGMIQTLSQKNSFRELELLGEAVTIAWEVLDAFTLQDGATWSDIIEGKDVLNLNRVVRAIITRLEHELPAIANPDTRRMYDPETKGKMFVTINFDSVDRMLYDAHGEPVREIGEGVSDSFFAPPDYVYETNEFLDWFRANRHDFLTRRQNAFIDAMSEMTLSKDTDYVDVNDFEALVGMKPCDLDRIKKRIISRTLSAWESNPINTRRGQYLTRQKKQWEEFVSLAESDDELGDLNRRLSVWVSDSEPVIGEGPTDFIYDMLTGDVPATMDFVAFLKGETDSLPAALLYRIYDADIDKIDRLRAEIDSLPAGKTVWGTDHERQAHNAEIKRRHKEYTEVQPCKVYGPDGEFLRVEESESNDYKLVALNPFGMTYDPKNSSPYRLKNT